MTVQDLAAFLFFSTVLWSGLMPNVWVWALLEVAAAVLVIGRLLNKEKQWIVPGLSFLVPWGVFILWVCLSFFWTANCHATLTGLYKILFLTLLLLLFINDRSLWESALRRQAVRVGLLYALYRTFFPALASAWIPYPSLPSGFLAMASILAFGSLYYFIMSPAIFLGLSLGPVVGWTCGSVHRLLFHRSRAVLIFMALLFIISAVPFPKNPMRHLWIRKWEDRFTWERLQIWKDSLKMFSASPLKGTGLGNFRDVYPEFKSLPGLRNAPYAHNEPLNFLIEMGLAGTLLAGFAAASLRRKDLRDDWTGAAAAALAQSLFDFNLRYPPAAVLFFFWLSTRAPLREARPLAAGARKASLAGLAGLALLFALPGAAATAFLLGPEKNLSLAIALDPANGFYRSRTGDLAGLEAAIRLEPRNVWYRRAAALRCLEVWAKTGDSAALETAENHYQNVLKLAPNAVEFQAEYKEKFNH